MTSLARPLPPALVAAAVALLAAGVVSEASPSKEIALTASGQAHAKAEMLRRADVGKGWKRIKIGDFWRG